jgi:hypothetical protein
MVTSLEKQLSIMSVENLKILAIDYIRHHINSNVGHSEASSINEKSKEIEEFLKTMIIEVINPLRDMYKQQELTASEVKCLLNDFQKEVSEIINCEERKKKLNVKRFFFNVEVVDKHLENDRLLATETTSYAAFKSDICEWILNEKEKPLPNEHYPTFQDFWEIEAKYNLVKSDSIKLNTFFTKHFGDLLEKVPAATLGLNS